VFARRLAVAFDREQFIADCVAANTADGQAGVREALERAVMDHGSVLADLGEPKRAGLDVIHRSPQLTIFAAKWAPQMNLAPHNHRMWALVGMYAGREDNIFWKRAGDRLASVGARALFAGEVATMAEDTVHSVTNPLQRFAGGLHIYGGDFFDTPRSLWDAETLAEGPSDGAVVQAIFERENARLGL
jgi:predicted metal-dependent enzyme (double-stranded beta helix superfamily)